MIGVNSALLRQLRRRRAGFKLTAPPGADGKARGFPVRANALEIGGQHGADSQTAALQNTRCKQPQS